ncbi:MAG: ornithine carbamoyltransferase [Chloroflexota bacterium]|nr:ornithine carbamoyltransferase [Chloroflexota bacterium]
MRAKDFLAIEQLTAGELASLIERAAQLKQRPFSASTSLANRTIALLFQKPSLRTRVSFEVGIQHLGGHCMYLSPAEVGLGEREAAADVGRVLSRYVDGLVARTYFHSDVEALAAASSVPVINGLSDRSHPCQILADLLTVHERFGRIEGLTIAYVGDGNNVTRSFIEAAPLAGFQLRVACPERYEPDPEAVAAARLADGDVEVGHDPVAAVRGADVIYTDAWFSMGQEAEREARAAVFPPFRVDEKLLSHASDHAIVMHCLPAHRGEEITEAVLDGPHSVVFDQAENRLHAQKALLAELFGGAG